MTALIREARAEDLPALGNLAGALVRFHHGLNQKRYLLVHGVERGYAGYFRGELVNPRTALLVAEDTGSLVGYAYGRIEERDWNALLDEAGALHDLYVAPAARGRGVGKHLLDAIIQALVAKGAPRILLHTAVENREAQILFEKAGFRTTMLEMTRETAP